MKGNRAVAALTCVCLLFATACSGGSRSNGLMEGASPDTSALALTVYDGEAVTHMYEFENQQAILDRLDNVKATEAQDWSLDDVTLPVYGLEIGTTDGWGISAAWSNGYWITQGGRAYRFDFDFATLEQDYNWSAQDAFPGFAVFPCARVLVQDENGWNSALLTAAEHLDPPAGIEMELVEWTSDTVTVQIANTSGEEWSYGEYYTLQALLDGVWYEIPPVVGNWGFPDIGLLIPAGEVQSQTYHLAMYGDLPPGAYRLVAYHLAVESTVTEGVS